MKSIILRLATVILVATTCSLLSCVQQYSVLSPKRAADTAVFAHQVVEVFDIELAGSDGVDNTYHIYCSVISHVGVLDLNRYLIVKSLVTFEEEDIIYLTVDEVAEGMTEFFNFEYALMEAQGIEPGDDTDLKYPWDEN